MVWKKNKILIAAMLLGLAVAATGCGEKGDRQEKDTKASEDEAALGLEGMGGITLAQGDKLYIEERLELELTDPVEYSLRHFSADAFGDKFYILAEYVTDTEEDREERQYFLNIFDGRSGELTQTPFELVIPKEGYSIYSMEAQGAEKLSLRLRDYRSGEDSDILAQTDMEGNVTALEEPFPDAAEYPWNPAVSTNGSRKVYDNTDGSVIISQWNLDDFTSQLFWYDKESHGRRAICDLQFAPDALYLEQSQALYYVSGGNLMRRNLADGEEKLIMSVMEIFPSFYAEMALLPGTNGELLFCTFAPDRGRLEVYRLSDQMPETEDEIRMAYLTHDGRGTATAAAVEYSLAHPDCPIRAEQPDGDQEDYTNRVLMELATGKGPELLWVFPDDLEMLEEKGILMDIRELIPEDVMEQLFPCVIEAGTVDGTMVALTPEFSVSSMVVPDHVWDKDSWTLSEFLDLAESRNEWGCLFGNSTYGLYPISCLYQMVPDLTDSPFLDMEQRKAHFDHEDFFRVIELCKKYGAKEGKQNPTSGELWDMLKSGDCVALCSYMYTGLPDFSRMMAQYRDVCHFIGCPGSKGNKGYILCLDGMLAVNAKAEHLDEIREYIALLLDYEKQLGLDSCSVRMDVTRESVVMVVTGTKIDEVTGELVVFETPMQMKNLQGNHHAALELKPDGTSYLEEYMDLLEHCTLDSGWPEQIRIIMAEELLPYFAGDRTAKDAVANIQNRVQLYLDEK